MDIPWFFKNFEAGTTTIELDETSARHALQVLRMRPGEACIATNGYGLVAEGKLQVSGKKQCSIQVGEISVLPPATHRKTGIAIAAPKQLARFEWFLEKATELGVHDIYPIQTRRSIRQSLRTERLHGICTSAMLQSKQAWLPILHPSQPISDLLAGLASKSTYHHKWIAHCIHAEKHRLAQSIKPGMTDSLVLIGPEGDFSEEEVILAEQAGALSVSLGDTRLRTETAALVAAAISCLSP